MRIKQQNKKTHKIVSEIFTITQREVHEIQHRRIGESKNYERDMDRSSNFKYIYGIPGEHEEKVEEKIYPTK